jgi:hypothetical protein
LIDNVVNRGHRNFLALIKNDLGPQPAISRSSDNVFPGLQKLDATLVPHFVDILYEEDCRTPGQADMKKDARLTIRIPRELKDKIEGIDRLYGVALPKIANECLKAFCAYVERKKQTPTFPLSISPSSLGNKAPNQVSVHGRKGSHNGHARRK